MSSHQGKPVNHIVQMLQMDHKRLNDYFFQFDQSNDPRHKISFAQTALNQATIHSVLEEDVFYPFVRLRKPELAPVLDRCLEQHALITRLMLDLHDENYSEDYEHKFFSMADELKQHMDMEEREILTRLSDVDLTPILPAMEQCRNDLFRKEATGDRGFTPQSLLLPELPDTSLGRPA
jgi:hemerythrin superfamily protein